MRESRDFLITMLQEAAPTSVGLKLPAHKGADPLCAGNSIMSFCLYSHKIHLIPLDDQRIAFWMAQAVYLEVYVKVGPLDGFWARHLHVPVYSLSRLNTGLIILLLGANIQKRFQYQAGSCKKRYKYLPHEGMRRRFVKKQEP